MQLSERRVKFVGSHSRGRQKGQEAQGRSRRLRPVFCVAEEIGNRRLRKAKVYMIYLSKRLSFGHNKTQLLASFKLVVIAALFCCHISSQVICQSLRSRQSNC